MKYLIRIGITLVPLVVLADPGHGAPVVHTHWWEVFGWVVAVGVAVWLVVRYSKRARSK